MPGGVSSPVRAFGAVRGTPVFVERGEGAYLVDVDGNRYVDYVLSWGPLILGHAHPRVVAAVEEALQRGTSFGAPSPLEVRLATLIREAMPSLELVRFVNSGTEATMGVLRLARAFTGRSKIVKFAGCYHGHADLLLVQAGSGVATLGLPDSPGVTPGAVADTLSAPYNDLAAVERIFSEHAGEIAAVIVEPIAGNMGVVPPREGFLSGLREICGREQILLVFDEVISGFRASAGGAQQVAGVKPDLTCLGKIIGGGLPVGAYGGRADVMELLAPAGPVYQAGTLSGNPLAMTAGLWSIEHLSPKLYRHLAKLGARLATGLADVARTANIPLQVNAVGSLVTPFFTTQAVQDYESAASSDTAAYAKFFRGMLARGIYPPPSQFEAWFLSGAHTERDVDKTIKAARDVFKSW
jgi:glutamate-1-semialdehyde 2,1-aminomutase